MPAASASLRVQLTSCPDTLHVHPLPATAVGVPTEVPGVFGVTYEELKIVGGTGNYDGAHGELRVFGAADLQRGETVFRYEGEICFRS